MLVGFASLFPPFPLSLSWHEHLWAWWNYGMVCRRQNCPDSDVDYLSDHILTAKVLDVVDARMCCRKSRVYRVWKGPVLRTGALRLEILMTLTVLDILGRTKVYIVFERQIMIFLIQLLLYAFVASSTYWILDRILEVTGKPAIWRSQARSRRHRQMSSKKPREQ